MNVLALTLFSHFCNSGDILWGNQYTHKFSCVSMFMSTKRVSRISVLQTWRFCAFSLSVGNIFVISPLDFEVAREHYLTVKATVGGQEALSDTATVTIHLTDINDNSPVFSQELYSAVVSEDSKPGYSVLTVSALNLQWNYIIIYYSSHFYKCHYHYY